jgi:hypothetical protein
MSAFLHLLRADWRRVVKTPSVLLVWLAFPLLLSLIEYAAFGQLNKSSTGLPRGMLLFVDRDRSTASGGLATMLQRDPMSDFFEVTKVDSSELADRRLTDNEGSASLLVPMGFQDSLLAGGPVELVLTPNPREYIRPPMVDRAHHLLEIGNRLLRVRCGARDAARPRSRATSPRIGHGAGRPVLRRRPPVRSWAGWAGSIWRWSARRLNQAPSWAAAAPSTSSPTSCPV